jgi:hypothetical protein
MPFFALALAMLSVSSLQEILERIGSKTQKFLSYASVLLLVISLGISIMQIGKASRDQDMLHDVYLMGTELPEGENVRIEEYLYDNWSLQFYFLRHFNVSLGPNVEQSAYYLVEKGQKAKAEYQIIPLDTKVFDLYKKE